VNVLVALLILAIAGAASLSPLLAILVGWLTLAVLVMVGINAYRHRVERPARRGSQSEQIVGWLE
jgi:membrane protein implicated in regulation of membrane protease activity